MVTKVTITNDDGTTVDYFPAAPTPSQVVEISAGQVVEIKAV
jgi:hypothetical protein